MKQRLAIVAAAGLAAAVALPVLGQQPDSMTREEAQRLRAERVRQLTEREQANEIRVYDLAGVVEGDSFEEFERQFADLRRVIDMSYSRVGWTLFAVRALPEEHERLEALIENVRMLGGGHEHEHDEEEFEDEHEEHERAFAVRYFLLGAPEDTELSVGDRLSMRDIDLEVILSPQLIVNDDEEGEIQIVRTETYIRGYQPVVSNNAVGYQPMIESIESGLYFETQVESREDGRVLIGVEGQLSTAEVVEQTLRLGEAILPVGLPLESSREIEAEVTIPLSREPIVISAMRGLENHPPRLLIAVSIQPFGEHPHEDHGEYEVREERDDRRSRGR